MRRNHTVRLDEPFLDSTVRLGVLLGKSSGTSSTLTIFKEDATPPALAPITPDSAIISWKYWDPTEASTSFLRPVCHLVVRVGERISAYIPALAKAIGHSPSDRWLFWEEIKPGRVDPLDPNSTFKQAQLQNGDIICFQRGPSMVTAADYLQDLLSWAEISLISFEQSSTNNSEDVDDTEVDDSKTTSLFISMATPYQEAIVKILESLGLDRKMLAASLRLFVPFGDGLDDFDDPSLPDPTLRLIPLKSPQSYPATLQPTLAEAIQDALYGRADAKVAMKPPVLWWRIETEGEDGGSGDGGGRLVRTVDQDAHSRWINLAHPATIAARANQAIPIPGFYFDAQATASQLVSLFFPDADSQATVLLEIEGGCVVGTLMADDRLHLVSERSVLTARPLSATEAPLLQGTTAGVAVVPVFAYQRPAMRPILWVMSEGGEFGGFPNILIVSAAEATLSHLRQVLVQVAGLPAGSGKRIRLAVFTEGSGGALQDPSTNWALLPDSDSMASKLAAETSTPPPIDWSRTCVAIDLTDLDLAESNNLPAPAVTSIYDDQSPQLVDLSDESSPPAKRPVGGPLSSTSTVISPRSHSIKIKSSSSTNNANTK